MSKDINPFRPAGSRGGSKAQTTDHAFRAIVSADAKRREAITAKLRQARLEQEAKLAAEAPDVAAPKAKKVKGK
jgi:hypothetical protein